MGGDVARRGLTVGGVITQGLTQKDLFKIEADARTGSTHIVPILHPLSTPVRAMILPLVDSVAASKVRDAVVSMLVPVLPADSVWLQDHRIYHATVYHASSHTVRQ